jgi:hydroxypyruvate reductase
MIKLDEALALIRRHALAAVDPHSAVVAHMVRTGDILEIAGRRWDIGACDRIFVLAVGKAAVPMALAAVTILGDRLSGGVVVTKYSHVGHADFPPTLEIFETGHPIPDAAGLRAAAAVEACLRATTPDDFVLLLLSGGGSALLPAPVDGVTLDDLQRTNELLLRAGATIVEINRVRKHLSRFKGGQMARLAAPAPVVALILSDVVGDPLDVIASGPTAPDPTTYDLAWETLNQYALQATVPPAVAAHLQDGMAGRIPETPKPRDPIFDQVVNVIVGSNTLAARAAVAEAERLGYHALLLTTFIEGEAREVAKVAVALAKSVRTYGHPLSPPACLVWGGETTVTVRGQGKGGRNQELALAAAMGLEDLADVALMALATDGTDGPTDAAGAVVDGHTADRARQRGWDLHATLQDNNAYPLLEDVGALLHLGPTGTNVNDLLVLIVI